MKVLFTLDGPEDRSRMIDYASAIIGADHLSIDDLEEIADYITTYIHYQKKIKPCYGDGERNKYEN